MIPPEHAKTAYWRAKQTQAQSCRTNLSRVEKGARGEGPVGRDQGGGWKGQGRRLSDDNT